MKRFRILVALVLLLLCLGLGSCTRSVGQNLENVANAWDRDLNASWDLFSKYFLNADPNDPYLD